MNNLKTLYIEWVGTKLEFYLKLLLGTLVGYFSCLWVKALLSLLKQTKCPKVSFILF